MTSVLESRDTGLKTPGSKHDFPAQNPSRYAGAGLLLAAVMIVAANLRLEVAATGPLLDQLRTTLHLDPFVTSVLPTLWVVCFAVVGVSASPLIRRLGLGTTMTAGIGLLIAGSAVRGLPDTAGLLAGTMLAAFGIALANVLLPAVVRTYFPHRIGSVTGLYTTVLTSGSAVAATFAVPLSKVLGGPSASLAAWGVPAVGGLLVWLAVSPVRRAHAKQARVDEDHPRTAHIPLRQIAKYRLSWMLAFYFALQSMNGYVVMGWLPTVLKDHGMSAGAAGGMVGIAMLVGIPLAFLVPTLVGRLPDARVLAVTLSTAFVIAYPGLILAPVHLAVLWAILLGVGMSAFPLVLALIGVRGGSPAGTAALSTFAQSAGYLMAAIAPFGFGVLGHSLGSWTVPLLVMTGVGMVSMGVGMYVASGKRGAVG